MEPLILGAVAYDPKVVTIWEGFRSWFIGRGLPFDFVLYSNYERLVEAQLAGDVQVAWDSPLAWIETERAAPSRGRRARALAMRDTDRDLTSVIVVRAGAPDRAGAPNHAGAPDRAGGPIRALRDLAGRKVATGAADSPQATLIPLLHLMETAGLRPGIDFAVLRHDLLVGKHGDHIGGEREAAAALMAGRVDAACMIDSNHLLFTREGTLPPGSTRILAQTAPYDHCNFTALDDVPGETTRRFTDLLLAMSYEDAAVRPLLDMEGLKQWLPGRVEGYAQLNRAVDAFGTLDEWITRMKGMPGAKG